MELQTRISVKPERHPIDYGSKVLLLGSCFAQHMGAKLEYFQFQHTCNPFGIIFNPVSVERLVTRAINATWFTEDDLFLHNEQWCCFEVHSSLNTSDKDTMLASLNDRLTDFRNAIREASHIICTYGTAWIYRHIESDMHVANCHKVSQKKFLKELLTVDEVSASAERMSALIRLENPEAIFIQTVSPVRHLKDGFVENARSKAHVLSGIHQVVDPRKRSYYFPSYEMMMDELRDYRFYSEDMIHPNETAVTIIWERFSKAWINASTQELQKEIATIRTGLAHRPFQPESPAHQQFLKDIQFRIEAVKQQVPHAIFE